MECFNHGDAVAEMKKNPPHRPRGSVGKYNRKKDTVTLHPENWKKLDAIGPSRGKAIDKLLKLCVGGMIMIELGNNLRIGRSDKLNFVLEKCRITGAESKTPGTILWSPLGHYPKLEQVAKAALQLGVTDPTDMRSLIDHITTSTDRIVEACKILSIGEKND